MVDISPNTAKIAGKQGEELNLRCKIALEINENSQRLTQILVVNDFWVKRRAGQAP